MTRREFIQQAILKMLPSVFEDMDQLNKLNEGYIPRDDLKGCFEIVVEEAITLADTAELRYRKMHRNHWLFDSEYE